MDLVNRGHPVTRKLVLSEGGGRAAGGGVAENWGSSWRQSVNNSLEKFGREGNTRRVRRCRSQ